MKITVNNEAKEIADNSTLADVLATMEIGGGCGGTAVAVNDEFAPRSGWAERKLSEGDKVLVIRAAYGG
jgi:sulfur carrier protein